MRSAMIVVVLVAASGCSLVTPPSGHMGGATDAAGSDAGHDVDTGSALDAGPSDAGPLPISATAACGEIALVACQGYLECCDTADPAGMDDCVTRFQTLCDGSLGPIFRAAETGYDPAIAGEVLAEGRSYFADARCGTEIVAWYHSRMGLQRALRGTIAPAQLCAPPMGYDAAASFSCDTITNGCIGTDSAGYYCTSRHGTTLECRSDADCIATDYCQGFTSGSSPSFGIPGHCQPLLAVGAPCNDDAACATYLCNTTLHMCAELNQQNAYCGLH